MTKGIIVVDEIPKSCIECYCCDVKHRCCDVINKYFDTSIYDTKPNWCPIKPITEYKHAVIKNILEEK